MVDFDSELARARGRQFLHELSVNSFESEKLKSAVTYTIDDLDLFESTCQMIELGSHYSYNFDTHELEYDDTLSGVTDQTAARKDFIIHCIDRLATRLFPKDSKRKGCVEEYLSGKLTDRSSYNSKNSYLQFATLKELEAGEKSLLKLLNKLLEGNFLSPAAKKQKHSEKFQQKPDFEALVSEILQKVKEHQMASSEGKEMQKRLIAELTILQTVLSEGKSCNGLVLTALFTKQVRSRFPDELCDQIDSLKEYLVGTCHYTPPPVAHTPPVQTHKGDKKTKNVAKKRTFLSLFFSWIAQFARMLCNIFKRLIYS